MDIRVLKAFVKHASRNGNAVPEDYYPTRAAAMKMFPKLAGSLAETALEVGGLGALAMPSIKALRDPSAKQKERSHAKWELGGLGVLAAHPAYEMGRHLIKR